MWSSTVRTVTPKKVHKEAKPSGTLLMWEEWGETDERFMFFGIKIDGKIF